MFTRFLSSTTTRQETQMASKHKITRTKPMFGNARSFSLRATRRKFSPNLQTATIFVEETGQAVRVRVTARELRTIDKIGLPEFLRRQGLSLKALTE
ncbi:MAG: 50S ribosomal protein L28 [Chloroflexi bacterium]|nr:50S ribosomal protein L28 [Chloroflexota bacterium]